MNLSHKSKIFLVFLILLLILFVLNWTNWANSLKNTIFSISSPIQKWFWDIGNNISNFLACFFIKGDLIERVNLLEKENYSLLFENTYLRNLEGENQILREALGINLQKDFNLSIAEVCGKDLLADSILIDKGFKDGLRKDLAVITEEKILIGKISEVYENFSRVILISDKDISFDVRMAETNDYAIAKGQGSLRLLIDLIPQQSLIRKDDLVVTTSFGGVFPKDLLIGKVNKIEKSDTQSFQKAEISLFIDIKELRTVFVINDF